MDLEYVAAITAALSVFFIASAEDVREREVSNLLWIILGGVAFALIALNVYTGTLPLPGASAIVLVLPFFLFADMFIDWNHALGRRGTLLRYTIGICLLLISAYEVYPFIGQTYVDIAASIPLWILFIIVLYKIDVIKGGADAKSLVTLAVLFPVYPPAVTGMFQPLFVTLTLPFFLSVLLMGAIFSLSIPIALFAENVARGRARMPHMFLGRQKDVSSVDLRKEWLLEVPDETGNPRRVKKLGSVDEDDMLERIRSLGWRTVWTSPKIPFILALTAGLLFVLVFGDPLLYI